MESDSIPTSVSVDRKRTGHSADTQVLPSRKANQRRTNRMAWLVVDGQNQGFHCQLREYSQDGAHITVAGLMGIPDNFSLFVEPDSIKYGCRVSMRKGNSVRVSFITITPNMRYRDLSARR